MKHILWCITLLVPIATYANPVKPTTFTMSCVIVSQDDKWTYRDYGFDLSYRDKKGEKHTLSAASTGTAKNCTQQSVSITAPIPAGKIVLQLKDFIGEAGSTIECTNTINYLLHTTNLGKTCTFMVKTPKYGSYTSTDECRVQMRCDVDKTISRIPH